MDPTSNEGEISESKSGSSNVEGVLDFNALQYDTIPDYTVCQSRTRKKTYFQQTAYTSGKAGSGYCVLNTGSDYINGKGCYLSFNIKLAAATTQAQVGYWGLQDSAANVIKDIRISDRAGNEIEYIQGVNVLAMLRLQGGNSEDYLGSTGRLFGGDSSVSGLTNEIPRETSEFNQRFILPLHLVSGLFAYNQLLPPQLMSGLRIQFVYEESQRAITFTQPFLVAEDEYTLSDLHIGLDTCKLTDSISRVLNTRSANDGLEIQFRTWFQQMYKTDKVTNSFQSRRAVSKAFGAIAHVRQSPATESSIHSMATEKSYVTKYQWRVGNLYFPFYQVISPNGITTDAGKYRYIAKELLYDGLSYFGKLANPKDNSNLNLRGFYNDAVGDPAAGTSSGGIAPICLDLERSTVQDVSGMPLNNSRVMELDVDFSASAPSADREVRLYLQYMKVLRVFMDNTEMEE